MLTETQQQRLEHFAQQQGSSPDQVFDRMIQQAERNGWNGNTNGNGWNGNANGNGQRFPYTTGYAAWNNGWNGNGPFFPQREFQTVFGPAPRNGETGKPMESRTFSREENERKNGQYNGYGYGYNQRYGPNYGYGYGYNQRYGPNYGYGYNQGYDPNYGYGYGYNQGYDPNYGYGYGYNPGYGPNYGYGYGYNPGYGPNYGYGQWGGPNTAFGYANNGGGYGNQYGVQFDSWFGAMPPNMIPDNMQRTFIDTSVLLMAFNPNNPGYHRANRVLNFLFNSNVRPVTSEQVLREFARYYSRHFQGDRQFASQATNDFLNRMEENIDLLPCNNQEVYRLWRELIQTYQLRGAQMDDAYVAATLLHHNIPVLLTSNMRDYTHFRDRLYVWGV